MVHLIPSTSSYLNSKPKPYRGPDERPRVITSPPGQWTRPYNPAMSPAPSTWKGLS